jgi:uncharacterized protein CbrC (UPF0167 family)
MALPVFRYHPDPLATGAVQASATVCACCGLARGYVYAGPIYGPMDYDDRLCPWCLADGSAHVRLGVEFFDPVGVGGYGAWQAVPESVVAEITQRTPSFSGWQQEQWFTHCGDAAAYLGRVGQAELMAHGPAAGAALRHSDDLEGHDWLTFLEALDKDGSPTGYLFRCLRCGALGGYTDSD